jgi:hypothetical protein
MMSCRRPCYCQVLDPWLHAFLGSWSLVFGLHWQEQIAKRIALIIERRPPLTKEMTEHRWLNGYVQSLLSQATTTLGTYQKRVTALGSQWVTLASENISALEYLLMAPCGYLEIKTSRYPSGTKQVRLVTELTMQTAGKVSVCRGISIPRL